jgi:ribosome biogenesis GTPase
MMTYSKAIEGIVIRSHGKSFIVRYQNSNISCEIRGKVKFKTSSTTPVAVGDDVIISLGSDGTGSIEDVKPRRTMFFRAAKGIDKKKQVIAANLDQLAIISSIKNPPLKSGLIDRFLISAHIGGLKPIIIINKIDLEKSDYLYELGEGYRAIGVEFCPISALTEEGIEQLDPLLKNHRTIFSGHSGVGKSAILNRLIPGLNLKTGEVSSYTNKGIHTTSMVELFALPNGGYVVDSPGLKILGLWQIERPQLSDYYTEFEKYLPDCRFAGCSHIMEPDCGVKKAVANREIPQFRYDNYVAIFDSLPARPDYNFKERN